MKQQHKRTVLVLDDDEINLMIMIKNIREAGFNAQSFTSGEEAYQYLTNHPEEIDIALLDKMLPDLGGIELLRCIKATPALRHIPVILQTGDVGVVQMREGLESGAYYYLSKPFHPEILTAILQSAAAECTSREELLDQMSAGHARFVGMLREGEFVLKTHAEARLLAAALAQTALYPEFVALGLMELLTNAIEHGNLDIGYEKKRKCLMANNWAQELATRASSGEYASRVVHVRVEKALHGLQVTISDDGKGFDWREHIYSENMPGQFAEPNGRGVAKALIMLDELRYNDKGNEVHCTINVAPNLSSVNEKEARSGSLHS